jgi:apolipoprotein N-acyltransferase
MTMMNFYRLRQNAVGLFVIAQVCILIAFAWKDFPVFIFFGFAPVFALIDHKSALKDSYLAFLVAIGTALIFAYWMGQSRLLSWVLYFAILASVFFIYILMQRITHDRLNKFALLFFILGMEYVLLKFTVHSDPVFLADLLTEKTSWTRWNIFTGYSGATLWILLTNLAFYGALFKGEKINLALLIFCLLMIVVPIMYSITLPNNALTKGDVISFYSQHNTGSSVYYQYGEFISRTGAWVSVLITIFTLVKGRTKKVLR